MRQSAHTFRHWLPLTVLALITVIVAYTLAKRHSIKFYGMSGVVARQGRMGLIPLDSAYQ